METRTKKPKVERSAGRGLEVRSFADKFHRAGRMFTREATVIPFDELSEEDVERLTNEPALAVKEVDLPAAEAASK